MIQCLLEFGCCVDFICNFVCAIYIHELLSCKQGKIDAAIYATIMRTVANSNIYNRGVHLFISLLTHILKKIYIIFFWFPSVNKEVASDISYIYEHRRIYLMVWGVHGGKKFIIWFFYFYLFFVCILKMMLIDGHPYLKSLDPPLYTSMYKIFYNIHI